MEEEEREDWLADENHYVNVGDAKSMELNGRPIFAQETEAETGDILDRNWVRTAFMVPDSAIGDTEDILNRYWSSASAKFVDGRLGCNIGINPRPQWTRYADNRVPGRMAGFRKRVSVGECSGNYGLGRAWSEGIDDPAQKIFIRCGVPRFNSLTDFLTSAFDREMTIMARTGRAPTKWYTLGKTIGTVIAFNTFPLLTIGVETARAAKWLFGRGTSKFFTLKPTMHYYWSMVNTLVNNHAVNEGIFKKVLTNENEQKLGKPYKLDETYMANLAALMPDVFNKNGFFDMYALATKAQRQANRLFELDYEALDRGSATDFVGYLRRDMTGNGRHSSDIANDKGEVSLAAFFNNLLKFGDYYKSPDEQEGNNEEKVASELHPSVNRSAEETATQDADGIANHLDALYRDGAEFAVFRVDHTGSVSESFGNTVTESQLSQKMNDISSTAREARFSLADGNLIGGITGSIGGALMDLSSGVIDGVTLGFAGLIPGLGGSGYIDIPKHWQSSSATLPRGSYTIQLISPYGNPISRMINIWIPFYMLLATAIPRSVGKQSYTSPFYCQIYDRGRLQSRLCMVESISIQRGTSNLAFNTTGKALAIDISLNVVDLSTIMHMPMSSGTSTSLSIDDYSMATDDDHIAVDYLNTLAGMDIYSQIYAIPKAQLKATKALLQGKQYINSPAFHASVFKNSMEDGFLNDITFGLTGAASGILEGMVRGNSLTSDAAIDGSAR